MRDNRSLAKLHTDIEEIEQRKVPIEQEKNDVLATINTYRGYQKVIGLYVYNTLFH